METIILEAENECLKQKDKERCSEFVRITN